MILVVLVAGCGTDPEDKLGTWFIKIGTEGTITLNLDKPGWQLDGTNGTVSGDASLNKANLGALLFTGKGSRFQVIDKYYWAKLDFSGSLSEKLYGTVNAYIAEGADEPSHSDWKLDDTWTDQSFTRVTN